MKRLICRLRGHRYRVCAVNAEKWTHLGHLHPLAGCYAICRRCSDIWDDLPSASQTFWGKTSWTNAEQLGDALPLPVARLVSSLTPGRRGGR
jgi:hypothetical protein